ncbi:MAG: hypothetical protein KDI09_02975, partial [Halioglobus sp.]|nr:hypothetical protein [Halioglobus sp.]
PLTPHHNPPPRAMRRLKTAVKGLGKKRRNKMTSAKNRVCSPVITPPAVGVMPFDLSLMPDRSRINLGFY